MASNKLFIMGILVGRRQENSPLVQGVLSGFGERILMRAGVPSPDRQKGLITLVLEGDEGDVADLAKKLEGIGDISVRTMSF